MSQKNILKLLEHKLMAQWHLDQMEEIATKMREETPADGDVTVYHEDVVSIIKRMKAKEKAA